MINFICENGLVLIGLACVIFGACLCGSSIMNFDLITDFFPKNSKRIGKLLGKKYSRKERTSYIKVGGYHVKLDH